MPYVPKFTPQQLKTVAQNMAEYPPGQVEADYRLGKISLNDKLFMLRTYGDAQREITVMGETAEKVAKDVAVQKAGGGATGEFNFWWQNQVAQYKGAWDAATRENNPSKSEAVFHAMMGGLETLRGLDIPGDVVERKMLEQFPESPGFARAANWAVWGVVNFYGITSLLKAPFKAAEGAAKATVTGISELSKFQKWLKDPVAGLVQEAKALDAAAATAEAQMKVGASAVAFETKAGTKAFNVAAPDAPPKPPLSGLEGFVPDTPQDLEAMTTKELIKHYERRAETMVRSKSQGYEGVSHKQTQAAASAKPISFEDIVARGPDHPVSATEIEAISRTHEEVLKHFNAVVDEAVKHVDDIRAGNRPDLVQAYKAHLAAMDITNPAFLSARGQTGRGLEYMKTVQDLVKDSKVFDASTRALASEKFIEGGTNDAIATTIGRMAELGKTERARLVAETAKEANQPGLIRTFYKSLLFARPGTHVANILGSESSATLYGINKTAAGLDPFSDVSMREALAYWGGMWDSRSKFFELYQKAQANAAKGMEKAGLEGTPKGFLIQHGPLKWLGLEDEFMAGHIGHGVAKAEAAKRGLELWDNMDDAARAAAGNKGAYLTKYIDDAMGDPKVYQELTEATEATTDKIIFRSPLSYGGERLASGIRNTPTLDYLMPVVKFPINAMKMGRDWTPGLQMLSTDFVEAVAEGGARADMARARMTLSWMGTSQVYEAGLAGVMTGGGPIDRDANAVWRSSGNVPYSIWGYSYKWAEPFGTWFGMVADLAQANKEMKDPNDVGEMFTNLALVGGRALESQYWLRIMQGTTGAVADAVRAADLNDQMAAATKTVLGPFKTAFQLGPVGRVIGEMGNPQSADMKFYENITKELTDLKQWFMASTPWSTGENTRPNLNYSGKIRLTPPTAGAGLLQDLGMPEWAARGLGMFTPPVREPIDGAGNDPVAEILNRRGISVGDNWKYYKSGPDPESNLPMRGGPPRVSLSGDQAYNWKQLSLQQAREYGTERNYVEAVQAWDQDPLTDTKDRNEQQKEFNRMHAQFKKDGLDLLRKGDPDVVRKEAERDEIEARQQGLPQAAPEATEEPGMNKFAVPIPVQGVQE